MTTVPLLCVDESRSSGGAPSRSGLVDSLLLKLSVWTLTLAGACVLLLGVSGRFLPHDERYLGMTAEDLCALHGCRIVHFMIHDRISFGGAALAVGALYVWLVMSPLRQGHAWAWWTLVFSGIVGFASFLAYLGYGYLDSWHGLVTLGLLPCFAIGLVQTRDHRTTRSTAASPRGGRMVLLATATGIIVAGATILIVGMTCVFVPQDLEFMGLDVTEMNALNPRLVSLIAHDRAGFGGAVCAAGIALFGCVWHATPSRGLWWLLVFVGVAGFGAGIGAHPAAGYIDVVHLAPAVLGAFAFAVGLALTRSEGRGTRC